LVFLGTLLTANSALATWSIVVINTRTREVCVSSATCLANFSLRRWLPVVRVGQGAGAAQSAVDISGFNRLKMWNGFQAGDSPDEILANLALSGGHQSRQYGIAGFAGPSATFTGSSAADAAFGVTGTVDDLVYAVQGNILTDISVVLAAESALRNTAGDLSQRVMAGMEAARALGGDGRCSCSNSDPTGCGAPPPNFTKSAHTAFIALARMGDVDGVCNTAIGCANGSYFLRRGFNGDTTDPDPILVLQDKVNIWRAALAGVTDQVHTEVIRGAQELLADGISHTSIQIRLVDIDGVPLPLGGHTVTVTPVHAGADPALASVVNDHGDGSYDFELTATLTPGRAAFHVRVDDGAGHDVLLWPPVAVNVVAPVDFHTDHFKLSASEGGTVTNTLTHPLGAAAAGEWYRVLGSFSGRLPGTMVGGVLVPLNSDRLFEITLNNPQPPRFEDFIGVFDGAGRATAKLFLPPAVLGVLAGQRMDLVALYGDGQGGTEVSASDYFLLIP
jgi:hypothetical protein